MSLQVRRSFAFPFPGIFTSKQHPNIHFLVGEGEEKRMKVMVKSELTEMGEKQELG